jgi:hypothetical protein
MKLQPSPSLKIIATFAVLLLITILTACQAGGQGSQPTPSRTSTVDPQLPASPGTASTRPADLPPDKFPEGGYDLTDPTQGLEAFSSFQQKLTLTLKGSLQGNPYEENQHIERTVALGDESILVSGGSTPNKPVYLFSARLGDYHYSQDQTGGSCRAEPVKADKKIDNNPALRLPAAFGIQEVGRGTQNNIEAIHYTFTEKSLLDRDKVLKKASGEVWVAKDSGTVLKYELEVEVVSQDISAIRTWSYELNQVNQGESIQLPDSCLPVLADLPVMPGAVDLVQMPGFQSYQTRAGRAAAVAFYHTGLSALGWVALPGSSPDSADITSAATVLSYSQNYLDGGRILVIQLSEKDTLLQVIAQTALTKAPIQTDRSAEKTATPGSGEADPDQSPAGNVLLPADLPFFQGAEKVAGAKSFVVWNIKAPAAEVTDFYTREMENSGWVLDQSVENGKMVLLKWSREGEILLFNLVDRGEVTQLTVTALVEP